MTKKSPVKFSPKVLTLLKTSKWFHGFYLREWSFLPINISSWRLRFSQFCQFCQCWQLLANHVFFFFWNDFQQPVENFIKICFNKISNDISCKVLQIYAVFECTPIENYLLFLKNNIKLLHFFYFGISKSISK